jgi:hypothetical protein
MSTTTTIINVYNDLKNRVINPSGSFDKAGRFFLEHGDLVNVREPSRSYPYSQMSAGRSLKYVKKVAEKFGCENDEEKLRKLV